MSEKEMFLQTWEREFQTTVKVLKAYPEDKLTMKPAEKSKSARDLAFVFNVEQGFIDMIIKGKLDFTGPQPQVPGTLADIVRTFEEATKANMARVKGMSESDFNSMMDWFVAPKTTSNMRKADIMWMMMMDMIHHRGQFSVYLRLAGAKVPSIYGPTADEPWM
jgi:uncharacterized damage-inducible protein DinB